MRTENCIINGLLATMVGVALGSTGCSSGSDKADGEGVGGASGGGSATSGGTVPTGGQVATGGMASGGTHAVGGSPGTGGTLATGGVSVSTGGVSMGGQATMGGAATGGSENAGGAAGGSTDSPLDCSVPVAMPTSAGTTHCGSYRTGRAGDLSWELWSNSYSNAACITYYDEPAFSAQWNNNGDFLARLGIEWGGTSINQIGEVTAEFMYTKTGTGGGFSYIGVYGWATSPCVEYYIIDDSYGGMPFSPWNMQQRGSATIDGEEYNFYSGEFGGTGGSRCGTPFQQYWSVRQSARECGVITVTKHFEEWNNVGMSMDNILEAKILAETGGGQGSIEFPIANVKSSQ